MATKFNFTGKLVRTLPAPAKGRTYYHDAKTPHLSLCVTSAGARTYYRTGRVAGKPERIRLGTVEELPLDDARKACQRITGRVAGGDDPAAERRATRHTLGDAWRHYHRHFSTAKKTRVQDERRWARELDYLDKRPLGKLDRATLQNVVADVKDRRGIFAGNKTRELLSSLFGMAKRLGWVDENPMRDVPRYKTRPRERFLQPDEMERFFAALEESAPQTRDFVLLCLLTGARRGNVMAMRWDELNDAADLWTIPAEKSKSKRPMTVVLVPAVTGILERRRIIHGEAEYVFPSRAAKSGHYSEPKTGWQTLLTRAGLKDLRIHDLRRTLGSWQASGASPLNIIAASLGHSGTRSVAIYARLQVETVRKSVQAATDAILQAAEKKSENAPKPH